MEVKLKVKRFDPEKPKHNIWYQDYNIDNHPSSTILDALINIREEVD